MGFTLHGLTTRLNTDVLTIVALDTAVGTSLTKLHGPTIKSMKT